MFFQFSELFSKIVAIFSTFLYTIIKTVGGVNVVNPVESFIFRFKEAMELQGIKQSELVKITGIGKSAISHYATGKYEPKQKALYLLAEALNVNEAWLMGYDVPMERTKVEYSADGKPADATLTDKDKKDIAKTLDGIMQDLENVDGLMFDGDPMSDEAIESLRSAMLMGLELVKLKNKKKYGRKTNKEPNK